MNRFKLDDIDHQILDIISKLIPNPIININKRLEYFFENTFKCFVFVIEVEVFQS